MQPTSLNIHGGFSLGNVYYSLQHPSLLIYAPKIVIQEDYAMKDLQEIKYLRFKCYF